MNTWIGGKDELKKIANAITYQRMGNDKSKQSRVLDAILKRGAFVNYHNIELGEIPFLLIYSDILLWKIMSRIF